MEEEKKKKDRKNRIKREKPKREKAKREKPVREKAKREKPVREKKKRQKPAREKTDRESLKSRLPFRRKANGAIADIDVPESSEFDVMVTPSEPIMRLGDGDETASWQKELALNCACAVLLTAIIAVFCMLIGEAGLIPFALTCPVVFMTVATIGAIKPGFARWIAANVFLIILLVTAVIWHSELYDGLCYMINSFYDIAEEAQAYLYKRLSGGDDATIGTCRAGVAWASAAIGLLAVLPPAKFRRWLCVLLATALMLALAYYGVIPSAVCIAVIIVALIAGVSRGNVLSFIPVVLAALLIFGVIVLADPGENYGISRVDENLRDRFALKSALIESTDSYYDEEDFYDYDEEDEESYEDEEFEEEESEVGTYAIWGLIIAGVLGLGAILFLLFRRYSKKRAKNRKGLKSRDPREAVAAMFPYTVRWLKGYGIEQPDASFTSMAPSLSEEFSDIYSDRFCRMYSLWSEAAYSDHEVSEETRLLMESFMEDTIDQVKEKCKFKDKLRLKLRHAL